jgi:hypothetical protein
VKPSHIASNTLVDRTRLVWQPRIGRELSCEDARQIAENVTGYFALLAEWSRAEMRSSTHDNGIPAASDDKETCREP